MTQTPHLDSYLETKKYRDKIKVGSKWSVHGFESPFIANSTFTITEIESTDNSGIWYMYRDGRENYKTFNIFIKYMKRGNLKCLDS